MRTNPPPGYLIIRAAPLDERGTINLSLASSWEHDAIDYYRHTAAGTRIVVEVNRHMPRVRGLAQFGNHEIPVKDVHIIVEDDTPLHDYTMPEPSDVDRAIAANVAALVEDRATIQLGIGTIPMVIGRLLKDRKDLGIHTELVCESHLDLIEAGSVTNAHKGLYDGVSVGTFALGEQRLYRWLADNPAFAMLPVEEINPVTVLARVNKMTSINSILTIDLSGQACTPGCLGAQTPTAASAAPLNSLTGAAVIAGRQEHYLPAVKDEAARRPRSLEHPCPPSSRHAHHAAGTLRRLGGDGIRRGAAEVLELGVARLRPDRHRASALPRGTDSPGDRQRPGPLRLDKAPSTARTLFLQGERQELISHRVIIKLPKCRVKSQFA